ncbi:MAG: HAMP domain-containing protein [Dehalococcoidales bacterium]|nr:HAMP domain-containing protein [Dehalococcoidales bacterium]
MKKLFMMRWNKLSYQILSVFVLVIFVCLVPSGWIIVRFSEDIVIRKISEGDLNLAERIAQQVAAEMASAKPTLELLAQTTGLRLMDADVQNEIDRVQNTFLEISRIYVANIEGEQIARTDNEELRNVSDIWSFQVARGGDELVSDIYLDPVSSEPVQTITIPVTDKGIVVGVLSADICFTRILVAVMAIDIGETANVVIVADNGRVVAHTRINQVQDMDLSRLPVIKAVLSGEEGEMKDYTDELGHQVLGSYVPISELGWGVIIQRPLTEIDAEVRQIRTTIILVTVAAVLFAILVGWLMSRQIAKPIRQLAIASKKVTQGDFSASVDVTSSNEVGVLADSFNQMILSLKKSRDELKQWSEELEQRVQERTIELEERSNELADTNVRLKEMSQHKSQFLANMSHELRTPLNSIIGYTKFILEGLEGEINEEQQKDLEIVYKNSQHLLELINDLLDLSRIEAGKTVLSPEAFSVSDLMSEVVSSIDPLARQKRLVLTCSVADSVNLLFADRAKTKQVLLNILGNAVKFTDTGSIDLEITENDDEFIFSVSDTGIGMKKDDLSVIFESFKQVGPAQLAGYEGTGLGLTISKQYVEMHNGRIWVESEPGKGSTFTFTLPKTKPNR